MRPWTTFCVAQEVISNEENDRVCLLIRKPCRKHLHRPRLPLSFKSRLGGEKKTRTGTIKDAEFRCGIIHTPIIRGGPCYNRVIAMSND